MPLPSLGSAVGSGVTCGSPWNRKGMVLRSVLSTNTKQASPQSVRFHVRPWLLPPDNRWQLPPQNGYCHRIGGNKATN